MWKTKPVCSMYFFTIILLNYKSKLRNLHSDSDIKYWKPKTINMAFLQRAMSENKQLAGEKNIYSKYYTWIKW